MNGQPYQPNQQPGQQGAGYQTPYGGYQQSGYTGYQQPVGQAGAGYASQQPGVSDAAYGQQTGYQLPVQQNTGYQQPGQQAGSYQLPVQQDGGYQLPVQQDGGYQLPYQQNTGYQQQLSQQDAGYQTPYQQPYQQGVYQQPYQQGGAYPQTQWNMQYQQQAQPNAAYQQNPAYQQNTGYQQNPSFPQFPSQGAQNSYPYQVGGVPRGNQQPAQPQREPVDTDAILRLVVRLMVPVLGVLFVLSMILGGAVWLKWLFVALSVAEVGVIWARPLLLQNDLKITFSCIFLVLALVAGVSAIAAAPSDAVNPPPASNMGSGAGQQNTAGSGSNATVQMPGMNDQNNVVVLTPTAVPTATPEPAGSGLEGEAVQRLVSFLYFWQANDYENMLSLCAPSWIRAQSAPMESLFHIQANRRITDFTANSISGTDNDISRTVNMTIMMTRYDNRPSEKYAFKVVMQKENDMWYVDPQSLQSNERIVTQAPSAEITQLPTPAPVADSNAVLYYNPNGGSRYHIDPNCKSTNSKYLPFSGNFTYGQLNQAPFNALSPCSVCGAPLRPAN